MKKLKKKKHSVQQMKQSDVVIHVENFYNSIREYMVSQRRYGRPDVQPAIDANDHIELAQDDDIVLVAYKDIAKVADSMTQSLDYPDFKKFVELMVKRLVEVTNELSPPHG